MAVPIVDSRSLRIVCADGPHVAALLDVSDQSSPGHSDPYGEAEDDHRQVRLHVVLMQRALIKGPCSLLILGKTLNQALYTRAT